MDCTISYIRTEWAKFQRSPKLGKVCIFVAIINMIFYFVMGILEIALPCPEKSLRCNKYFLDNKAVVMMVFSVLQVSNIMNGVLEENFYELIGSFIATLVTTLDVIVTFLAKTPANVNSYTLLVASIVYQVFVLCVSYPIYTIYNRRMHIKIGSDPKTQKIYKNHLLSLTLLKFDATFSITAIILAGKGVFNGTAVFIGAILCAIIVIAWSAIGWFGMSRENNILMVIFFIGFLLSPIYCAGWIYYSKFNHTDLGKRYLAINFAVVAVLCLILHVAVGITTIIRRRNFGKGLLATLEKEYTRRGRAGREDDGFAHLDSDEEFELDVGLDGVTASTVDYQRMHDDL